jgi:hypothetical protein
LITTQISRDMASSETTVLGAFSFLDPRPPSNDLRSLPFPAFFNDLSLDRELLHHGPAYADMGKESKRDLKILARAICGIDALLDEGVTYLMGKSTSSSKTG